MMTNSEIQTHLEEKMVNVLLELEQKLKRELPVPILQLKRLGKCAGRSSFVYNTIQINPDFCQNGHWADTLNVTLPHELAHIVADHIYSQDYRKKHIDMRYTPHGKLWKSVMKLMGLPAEAFHTMSLEGVHMTKRKETRRPHRYQCGCCVHHVTEMRHRRFQTGKYLYFRCAFCKEELKYVGCEQVSQ